MAEKIKKFFAKKKADAKFKLAGPGHKLNESSTTVLVGPSKKKPSYVPSKLEPSDAARQAAEAALVRVSNQRKDTAFNTSLAAIQAKVRRELEAEKKGTETHSEASYSQPSKPIETELELSSHLAVNGVYFKCPLISDEVLTKDEWKVKIKEFLFNTLEEERGMTACLIIYSCNYNRSKVIECVNVLCRYLDNIIANSEETKFHKIRCSNATFIDKVVPVLGATDLLYSAGFRQQKLEINGVEEEFWVWSIDNIDGMDTLQFLRDTLKSESRVELEIDRNIQVLSPAQAAKRIELPQDFYAISAEELKREKQQSQSGTFSVYERFSEVFDFVKENLEHEGLPFILTTATGHRFEENDKDSTLVDLRLVPATILMFQWDPSVEEDLKLAGNVAYLKPEVMILVQSM
ncbi:hypothetical protein NQ314_011953 [Rhamnusium bicolor]|uniref:PUB domain-containing protein n=1 Tax=Rhamnusium bicolor TaxID=1586634 RepID=A0AAV8XFH5_9CUCU|nr:hypothetical protein NQ314_011953 [Rhamnusium bicolor]